MKKFLLLIPLFLFSLLANAATININTGTADALRLALNSASSGDVIVMAAGTYVESNSNYIAFNAKSVTVKAADGATVIIKPHVPFTIAGGARAEIKGVKIDASELCSVASYSHLMYSSDGSDNNRLILDGCEVYGYTEGKAVIACRSSYKLDSLIINNCKFYNHTTRSCVFLENTANKGLIVTNSTFNNIETTVDFSAGVIDSRSTSGKVQVDHCTFYNCYAKNTDYGAIKVPTTTDSHVSNCIFMMSESYSGGRAVYNTGGTVDNCLTYNYTKDSAPCHGIHSGPTITNCFEGDPLFSNAASGNFSIANNWNTMSLSPACCAATDGSDLGDPRWSDPTLPSTSFASPYQLTGNKAKLSGNIWYNSESNYLYGDGGPNKVYGTATWKIHATKACIVGVALNLNAGNTSGHKIRIEIKDAEGNSLGEFAEQTSTLPGTLSIPAEGDYTIILHEDQTWSSAKIDNITLSYIGGDVQTMPGTTDIADAWFSSEGTRADGKIDFPNSTIQDGWVKWNVAFASAVNCNVIVNVNTTSGHSYTVALYRNEEDESPITVSKLNDYSHTGTPVALELGSMEIPAGNYILKVTNGMKNSNAELLSVQFAYAGGAAVDLSKTTPAELLANADAILSSDWSIEDGKIVHPESKALTGWAKWNVDCADKGNYNVTVNIASDNGHLVRVQVFEDEAEPAIYTLDEANATKYTTGTLAINLGNIALEDKEYVFKVSNTVSSSHVQIVSIDITYKNGAAQNIPAALTLTDAILSANAYIESNMLYFAPHDTKTIPDEWAKWNLHVAAADANAYQFTVNVTSPNGQKYQILIKDNENNEIYKLTQTSNLGSSDRSFTTDIMYLASGDYTLEMRNVYPHSDGHLVSISAAKVAGIISLDEEATDNTVINDNYRNGTHSIHLGRTIIPGMYNTICIPFDVADDQLKEVFGNDVDLLYMSSATIDENNVLYLNFDNTTSIYHGTPYLIKTSKRIANPIFAGVEINVKEGQATGGEAADYIGNFVKKVIHADEDDLFLGANSALYWVPEPADITIKGFRGYFNIKSGSGAPKRARLVIGQGSVPTDVELIDGALPETIDGKAHKFFQDGQLIIVKDGVYYNAFGFRVK